SFDSDATLDAVLSEADANALTAGSTQQDGEPILGGESELKKFDGLQMEADIAEHNLGGANLIKKNVANIKWTAAKASIGIGMGKEINQIIHDAFNQQQKPFDGSLNMADFNNKVQSTLTFSYHEEKDEMNGAIIFLNPNMKDEIGRIEMHNVGFK